MTAANSFSTHMPSKRLVLCFDGTGNSFQGSPGDTNIVKLFNMFDRSDANQMHYYQPGIGTYPADGPVNVGFLRGIARKYEAMIDMALATSFDAHVIAGYRFIMRYYNPGDRIYVFGFSRGAFTARFLARMLSHIGLLSRGNDEMVPFAFKVYQEYEQNRGSVDDAKMHETYMNSFKQHFCRNEREAALARGEQISPNESGIKVHFLGLFDCVSSVGNLDVPFFKKMPPLPAVTGTARFVRHAVAIDERRVKFKAALFSQERTEVTDDIKEVWFPGNHGDIGGGWSDVTRSKQTVHTSDVTDDYFQLSDITLKWMIDEISDVDAHSTKLGKPLTWNVPWKHSFLKRFQSHMSDMMTAKLHDTMVRNGGSQTNSWAKILLWHLIEYLPFGIKRWEFVRDRAVPGGYKWDYVAYPLNKGGRRDIPSTALFHHATISRMQEDSNYLPTNNLWIETSQSIKALDDDSDLIEQSLDVLAGVYKTGSVNGAAKGGPVFVYAGDATIGSAVTSEEDALTDHVQDWDRIYRVAML